MVLIQPLVSARRSTRTRATVDSPTSGSSRNRVTRALAVPANDSGKSARPSNARVATRTLVGGVGPPCARNRRRHAGPHERADEPTTTMPTQ